jgi:hypothetical protein
VAALGRLAEVPGLRQGHQVLQVPQVHRITDRPSLSASSGQCTD